MINLDTKMAARCARLSEGIYLPFNKGPYDPLMGMKTAIFYDEGDTQAILCHDGKTIYLVFRGTESLQDFIDDVRFIRVKGVFGQVHKGGQHALNRVWDKILKDLAKFADEMQLVIMGHSLGGLLATIATARLLDAGIDIAGLYTFGCPRVGDVVFADTLDALCYDRHWRFVNNNDVVPRVPMRVMGYTHAGQIAYFSEDGYLQGRMSWLALLADRLEGRLEDLFELGTDGIKDHFSAQYTRLLETLHHANTSLPNLRDAW